MNHKEQQWTETIESSHSLFDLKLKEVWRYKDLVYMFVRRDFVAGFKQTILGPIWFFVNPIMTTIVFTVVFGNIANISTDGVPKVLFYLAGITLWNYFSSSLTSASSVFTSNAGIFGKVYFPRMVMPITIVISNLMRFGVQFMLFLIVWGYYYFQNKIEPNMGLLFTPILVFLMAIFSMGAGMIFSSLTTKYRDLQMLLGFGVSLLMYATPVIYPLTELKGIWYRIAYYNPLTGIFEAFKYGWLGTGEFSLELLGVSSLIIFAIFVVGLLTFNKVEKSFMDTV